MKRKSSTCIAAIYYKKGKIAMAADRRETWDYGQCQTMQEPKIAKRLGMILAGTGDSYLCDLIVNQLVLPDANEFTDIKDYMHNAFHGALYQALVKKKFSNKDKMLVIAPHDHCEIVIAVKGTLWSVIIENPDPENQMVESGRISILPLSLPYATGCGGKWAWASLDTTEILEIKSYKERLKIALEVAAKNAPGCDNNVDIIAE